MNIRILAILLAISAFLSCEKTQTPIDQEQLYEIKVNNEFNQLNATMAIFASDPTTGETRAFRWIPGEDTILFQVPGSKATDRFDCTILKITTVIAPGTGVRDTLLSLNTYTDFASGEQINLRSQVYQQSTALKFKLTGMSSLDSITIPDAYAISRPSSSNDYTGEYFCYHTGKCWMKILVDGDKFWRFARFDNISGESVNANTLNTNLFLSILAPPLKLNLPFTSAWEYKVDGLVDTSKSEFFPLSAQYLVPGSATPIVDAVNVIEPVNNDLFEPNRPYNGLRVKLRGAQASAVGGYTYISDHLYETMPASLPVPDFDLESTILAANRQVAVGCSGNFDLLSFSRIRSAYGIHLNIKWEVFTKPKNGIVSYRLPEVPTPLGDLYKPLKNYDFNPGVQARAESYESNLSYEQIVRQHISASDILWQAKAGYLGREESF